MANFKYNVSIIVPVYRVEQYIHRCVDSLLNQTLKKIEIILVDDQSPDNCPAICDDLANSHENIKVVHKANGGLGLARNSGLSVAEGEFVAFVDSDDYIDLDMMEKLYSECKSSQLDVIYSEFNTDNYPGYNVFPHSEKLYINEEIESLRLDFLGAEPEYISSVKYEASACKGLYSLDLIRKNNISFLSEREYISEDVLFNLNILKAAQRVKIVPWQMYHYCLNGASLTHVYRPDRWEKQLTMLKELLFQKSTFKNPDDVALRVKRTAMSYARMAMVIEAQRKDIGNFQQYKKLKEIVEDKRFQAYLKQYPILKMPISWTIFALLLKYKCALFLYFLIKKKYK